jgi:hypothetical protein
MHRLVRPKGSVSATRNMLFMIIWVEAKELPPISVFYPKNPFEARILLI